MITESFSNKLNDISEELGMNPRDLLLVMYLESGVNSHSVNTTYSKNPQHQARGLIQFMPSTLKGMGLRQQEIDTFAQKPAEEQLDYVKKYVQSHKGLIGDQPFTSATQYYIANFFPIALKRWRGSNPIKNANTIVVSKKSKDPREVDAYNANTVLDSNRDGVITVGDITNLLMKKEREPGFQQIIRQFNAVAGNGMVSEKNMKRVKRPHTLPSENIPVDNLVAKFMGGVSNLLDSLTPATAKSQMNYLDKYGCTNNMFLIKIISESDLSSKLEYARILSMAFKEELKSNSETFTNGNDVEIQCVVNANKDKGLKAVEEVSNAISDVFDYATTKIGGIKIKTSVIHNLQSRYQKLDIKLSEVNYRKFHLKFIK